MLPGAISDPFSIPKAQGTDDGSYTVTVTNSLGSVTSNPAVVVVHDPPVIITAPKDLIVSFGNEASFAGTSSLKDGEGEWLADAAVGIATPKDGDLVDDTVSFRVHFHSSVGWEKDNSGSAYFGDAVDKLDGKDPFESYWAAQDPAKTDLTLTFKVGFVSRLGLKRGQKIRVGLWGAPKGPTDDVFSGWVNVTVKSPAVRGRKGARLRRRPFRVWGDSLAPGAGACFSTTPGCPGHSPLVPTDGPAGHGPDRASGTRGPTSGAQGPGVTRLGPRDWDPQSRRIHETPLIRSLGPAGSA